MVQLQWGKKDCLRAKFIIRYVSEHTFNLLPAIKSYLSETITRPNKRPVYSRFKSSNRLSFIISSTDGKHIGFRLSTQRNMLNAHGSLNAIQKQTTHTLRINRSVDTTPCTHSYVRTRHLRTHIGHTCTGKTRRLWLNARVHDAPHLRNHQYRIHILLLNSEMWIY